MKTILLVPDRPGWAFDHRARDMLALRWPGFELDIRYLRQVRKCDGRRYDLIYTMTLDGARILNREAGIPLARMAAGITSLRSLSRYRKGGDGELLPPFVQLVSRLRGINTASDEFVRLLEPHCRIYKTRVGVDTRRFRPAAGARGEADGPLRVGWVGRIDKPDYRRLKGYDLMADALKPLTARLDIRTFSEHYAPRAKMAAYYRSLDCFVCSSESEHIPLPVLEAAACGVPVIATRVGIVPELIRHAHNGLIVTRDSRAIRRAVRRLIKSPRERRRFGRRIRREVERRWSWERCQRDWIAFFKAII